MPTSLFKGTLYWETGYIGIYKLRDITKLIINIIIIDKIIGSIIIIDKIICNIIIIDKIICNIIIIDKIICSIIIIDKIICNIIIINNIIDNIITFTIYLLKPFHATFLHEFIGLMLSTLPIR